MVVWLSVVVCPAFTEQLGDVAGPRAPICCWRCTPAMYNGLHYNPEQADGKQPRLVGCHSPLVVHRLSNGRAYLLADKLERVGAERGDQISSVCVVSEVPFSEMSMSLFAAT